MRALREDSARAVSATTSSSSISVLPLMPETLNSSSPTRVMEDCCQGVLLGCMNKWRNTYTNTPTRIEHAAFELG